MWSIECVCSSLWSVIVALFFFFFSYWHRAIGSKLGPLEVLAQLEFIGVCRIWSTWACFDHISLIQTRNRAPFFFIDSLFFKEYSFKISKFFPSA